jgi:hypothetical protein
VKVFEYVPLAVYAQCRQQHRRLHCTGFVQCVLVRRPRSSPLPQASSQQASLCKIAHSAPYKQDVPSSAPAAQSWLINKLHDLVQPTESVFLGPLIAEKSKLIRGTASVHSVLLVCPYKPRNVHAAEAPPPSFPLFNSSSGAWRVYTEDAPVIRMLQSMGRMAVAEEKLVVSRARERCYRVEGGLGHCGKIGCRSGPPGCSSARCA